MRRSPLKRRSSRKAREYEVRRELVTAMLARAQRCQAGQQILAHLAKLEPGFAIGGGSWKSVRSGLTCGGQNAPDDVHELLPRSAGGSITDERNCIAVCRVCHDWIHRHPNAARHLGLLRSRYVEAE